MSITGVLGVLTAAVILGDAQRSDTFPTFDRVLLLEKTSETSANVSIGDVDGDGRLDIVLAKGRHWPLVDRVLLGDRAGHFKPGYDLGTASDRSYSGRLVDLDRDGDLDVVISNDAPDPKLVYLNDGKGHFHVGSNFGKPTWPTRNATVADIDGDGLPDIVAANRGDSTDANYICLNRGNGRFDGDCIAFSREPATTIAAADFNRDGRIDLAVPHRDGGQSRVYLAGPKGAFDRSATIPFGLTAVSMLWLPPSVSRTSPVWALQAKLLSTGERASPARTPLSLMCCTTLAEARSVPASSCVSE